ncbi:sensor histidine kinase [Alkaliphilus transvaalensis]|uniref:sensor histidine kinase n=1 Tax=Alkaliphilus transvaalensis TaxID=114628 RepID=UPI00047869DE|nr:HAMP domain-containing sensor histidine kinase [Alkaliphilus transvaalensis]
MRRNYFKAILVFLIIFSFAFFIGFKINKSFGILKNGDTYSDDEANMIYSLTDYQWDSSTNTYYFDLIRKNKYQQLELIYGKLPSEVYINGTALKESSFFTRLLLSSHLFIDNKIRIVFDTNIDPHKTPIYVTTTPSAEMALTTFNIVFAFSLGITFLMFIYGLSLYHRKKTEKYLLWFAIYTGALTLWSVLPLFVGTGINFLRYYAFAWCVILDIVICFKMFDIKLPGRLNLLLSVRGVISILVLWSILESIFPKLHSEIYVYSLFLFSIGVLIYACVDKRKGGWLLISGHALSLGLRMAIPLSSLSSSSVSYPLRALQFSKFFNVPFAFCCMLLINHIFAEKYTEAEILAKELEQINQNLDKKVLDGKLALEEQMKRRHSLMMNIFHDLRTPLFVIQGCTEKITSQPQLLNTELPIIKERLDFTKHLVEDLFLMAKLEDKQVILEMDRIPVSSLIKNVISACSIEAEGKNIYIDAELKCECLTWGDEYRLKQAFQNLLLNAIYYTKPKGRIYISLEKKKNITIISFTDTGIGISPQDIDKIFDRYYRISHTDKHQSTGLGLSIAQEIIQQHLGSISVESQLGSGTTFTVHLPIIS